MVIPEERRPRLRVQGNYPLILLPCREKGWVSPKKNFQMFDPGVLFAAVPVGAGVVAMVLTEAGPVARGTAASVGVGFESDLRSNWICAVPFGVVVESVAIETPSL